MNEIFSDDDLLKYNFLDFITYNNLHQSANKSIIIASIEELKAT